MDKTLEGSGRGLMEAVPWNMPGGTAGNYRTLIRISRVLFQIVTDLFA
jgi:hypothetical protein